MPNLYIGYIAWYKNDRMKGRCHLLTQTLYEEVCFGFRDVFCFVLRLKSFCPISCISSFLSVKSISSSYSVIEDHQLLRQSKQLVVSVNLVPNPPDKYTPLYLFTCSEFSVLWWIWTENHGECLAIENSPTTGTKMTCCAFGTWIQNYGYGCQQNGNFQSSIIALYHIPLLFYRLTRSCITVLIHSQRCLCLLPFPRTSNWFNPVSAMIMDTTGQSEGRVLLSSHPALKKHPILCAWETHRIWASLSPTWVQVQ